MIKNTTILCIIIIGLMPCFINAQPKKIPYKIGSKWSYCDYDTKKIFRHKWDTVTFYTDDVAWVKDKTKWYLLNSSGKYITKQGYDSITPFIQGVARVKVKNKLFWINTKAHPLLSDPVIVLGCGGVKGYGVLMYNSYKLNGKVGLILYGWDSIHKINTVDSLLPKFDAIEDGYGTLIKTKISGKYGLTNSSNGTEVLPHIYDSITFNNEEIDGDVKALHLIKKDNMFGFLANNGVLFINPKYKTATMFMQGLSLVSTEQDVYFYIDYKGFEYIKTRR